MSNPAPGPSGVRPKKRMHLSLEQKVKVIKRIKAGERKTHVARSLGLNESTIRTIYKNKKDILACVKTFGGTSSAARSKVACRALIMTERYLEEYIRREESNNVPVNSAAIQHHALAYYKVAAKKFGVPADKFRALTGWLCSFLKKKKIRNVKLVGERATADEVEAEKYPDLLAKIVEDGGYVPEQIYNMDETGLQWKRMPNSTFVPREVHQAKGRKINKNRITILFCCNLAATCKMKPLVVHTAARPHPYRHLKSMDQSGVYWKKANRSWMNASIIYN
ncbi:MAG: hypothetical protein KAG66_10220 [Methylococcales bacterium]|nr:hypothetical protein [Methylococcales bacterium]